MPVKGSGIQLGWLVLVYLAEVCELGRNGVDLLSLDS